MLMLLTLSRQKYLLLFGTRPLISITCFSPLCCHHDGVIAGTSLSSRPRYSCAHSQWLAVACRWRPTLNKLFSLKISVLFQVKTRPCYEVIKVHDSRSRIRGTGDARSRIRGVSLSILYWIFRLLYFFTYPAKYGKIFAYYRNKIVKSRGIMVKVKQGNNHTFMMYTRVRSVVVDWHISTTTLLFYKVISRIVKNGRVW